ncbi:ninjurin-1 isoform X1 [Diorhabda sublineata]|uniref:ninjurin-1 isoform X1 n=1 Tax=Diorhabda sublineata TaxID=1163346 RepID=UPI0024E1571B|nr:ninjurin-1 isoform X1 [Diorhabda sublineata]
MSVAYTALSQGQGDNNKNEPSESHSTASAPMAKVEADGLDGPDEEVHRVGGNNSETVQPTTPNIAISEAPDDEKPNHDLSYDQLDGHLGNHLNSDLHYRPGTPSSLRSPNIGVGLNFDTELGSLAGDTIPDINVYQHKKTLAQGMMDLALFSANANQLRYVLDSYQRHPYYWPSFIFIVLSLSMQVMVSIGLIWNSLYNVSNEKHLHSANKINNFTVLGTFLVVVINVFITSFGAVTPLEGFPQVSLAPRTSESAVLMPLISPNTSMSSSPLMDMNSSSLLGS